MARTVIPGPRREIRQPGDLSVPGTAGDTLPEKLVKYVPAETLAFYIPATALLGNDSPLFLIIITLIAGLVSLVYLKISANRESQDKKPTWYFYILAFLAFLAWALGTNANLASIFGLNQKISSVILLLGVFAIPALDGVLASVAQKPTPRPGRLSQQ